MGIDSRGWVALFAVVALLAVSAQTAQAENLFWYGEGNSTCWQSGFPGPSAFTCDSVGASYLPTGPHMREGGIGPAVSLVQSGISGDYCDYYNIGEGLDTTNENSQSKFTGFNPPTPYGLYQEGNHYGPPDVCQAYGSTWGQVVRGNSANAKCGTGHAPCGMQHYVALGAQGNNNRPWSSTLRSPSLVISTESNPQEVKAPNSWGYVCPLLRDSSTGGFVEFCLETWHVGSGSFPAYTGFDQAAQCNFGGGQAFTGFAPGTRFAELVAGSAQTFEFNKNPAPRTFTARISPANLVAAVEAIERIGCGRLSHNAADYALVGIEDGVEGGGMTLIGNVTAKLQAYTNYLPAQAKERLYAGETLLSNEALYSPNNYQAIMQPDGNFVVYNPSRNWIWQSNTYGDNGAHVTMQPDGNLVLYTLAGQPAWMTNTEPSSGDELVMQNDGDLIVYSRGRTLWSSFRGTAGAGNTMNAGFTLQPNQALYSPNGAYEAIMQPDGNFVIYNASHNWIWQSYTYGATGAYLIMQPDGNLVIYNSAGAPIWSTQTEPSSNDTLVLENNGNLVIYSGGRAIWQTGT